MPGHELVVVQQIPASLDDVWYFFSNPHNLKFITPPYLDFQFLDENLPTAIYAGQKIRYKVSPIFHIPIRWTTVITKVEMKKMFVDEQLEGPYQFWRHEHRFVEKGSLVEMRDRITYRMPMGLVGSFARYLFVKRQLEKLFAFRERQVSMFFGMQAQ